MIATRTAPSDLTSHLTLHRAALVALSLLPLLLLLVNRHWTCNVLCRDHWIYFGYYQNLPEFLAQFSDVYFGTRLTIVLPGWLAYRFLPPMVANDVLHLTMCYTVLFSLYSAMRMTLGTRTALLASVFLGCHWYFLTAVGGDYADGYALVYTSLSLVLLTKAARSAARQRWLFGAGIALAALVVANLIFTALVPVLLLNYLLLSHTTCRRPLTGYLRDGGSIFAGGALMVAILGVINRQFGGPLLFFMPSVNFGSSFLQGHSNNPFKAPWAEWTPHATWMLLPVLALAGGVWHLGLTAWRREWRRSNWLGECNYQIVYLPLILGLIALNCSPQFCLLQMWLYATPLLLVWAVLALAQQWRDIIETMSARHYGILLGAGGLLMVLSMWQRIGVPDITLPLAVTLGLIVLCSLAPLRVSFQPAAVFVVVVLMAAGNLWARQSFSVEHSVPMHANDMELRKSRVLNPIRRDCFAAANDVLREIRQQGISVPTCSFWYDIHEPLGLLFDDLASTNLARTIVGLDFPHKSLCGTPLARDHFIGKTIAVLSSTPQPRELLESALADCDVKIDVLSERLISRRAVRFQLVLVKISAK